MQVTLLIANEISLLADGKWDIKGVYNTDTFATFPATLPKFQGLLIFDLIPDEYESLVDFQLQLRDSVGNVLRSTSRREFKYNVIPNTPRLRDYQKVELGPTTFEKPGWYYFSLLVLGEEKNRVPHEVLLAQTMPSP